MGWCGRLSFLLCACLWRTAAGQTPNISLQFVSEAEPGFPNWTVPTMCVVGRIGLVQAYVQQGLTGLPELATEGGGQFTAFELLGEDPGRSIQLSFQSHNASTGKLRLCGWGHYGGCSECVCVCVCVFRCVCVCVLRCVCVCA